MQKVDIVIAGVGVVALIATTLGVVFYEEASSTGEPSLETVTDEGALMHTFTGMAAGSTVTHDFQLPDNATAATFDLAISFTGQSGQGAGITFSAHFVDPNGNLSNPPATTTMAIGANTGAGSTTLTIPLHSFYTMPDDVTRAHPWSTPLQLVVTASSANDALSGVPAVNYTFSVAATGDLDRYQIAAPETPNPSTA
jgi:hypothetical protein